MILAISQHNAPAIAMPARLAATPPAVTWLHALMNRAPSARACPRAPVACRSTPRESPVFSPAGRTTVRGPGSGSGGDRSRQSFLASMGQMFRRLLELHGLDAVGMARQAGVDLAALPAPGE